MESRSVFRARSDAYMLTYMHTHTYQQASVLHIEDGIIYMIQRHTAVLELFTDCIHIGNAISHIEKLRISCYLDPK